MVAAALIDGARAKGASRLFDGGDPPLYSPPRLDMMDEVSSEATSAEERCAGLWGATTTALSLACLAAYLLYMAGFLVALTHG